MYDYFNSKLASLLEYLKLNSDEKFMGIRIIKADSEDELKDKGKSKAKKLPISDKDKRDLLTKGALDYTGRKYGHVDKNFFNFTPNQFQNISENSNVNTGNSDTISKNNNKNNHTRFKHNKNYNTTIFNNSSITPNNSSTLSSNNAIISNNSSITPTNLNIFSNNMDNNSHIVYNNLVSSTIPTNQSGYIMPANQVGYNYVMPTNQQHEYANTISNNHLGYVMPNQVSYVMPTNQDSYVMSANQAGFIIPANNTRLTASVNQVDYSIPGNPRFANQIRLPVNQTEYSTSQMEFTMPTTQIGHVVSTNQVGFSAHTNWVGHHLMTNNPVGNTKPSFTLDKHGRKTILLKGLNLEKVKYPKIRGDTCLSEKQAAVLIKMNKHLASSEEDLNIRIGKINKYVGRNRGYEDFMKYYPQKVTKEHNNINHIIFECYQLDKL